MNDPSPKILLFDLETSPALGYFFGHLYETNIISVREQSYILSFAYKWLGEKTVHTFALPDFPRYKHDKKDDGLLVEKLGTLLNQAEIVVAHNGDRFDITTTNTRLLFHGHTPLIPFKTVDTLKEARRVFKFPSNKLDDLGEYLEVGRKLPHTGKHLWLSCMDGDKDAWRQMKKYNAQDVVLLELIYLKLRPFMRHYNVNIATRTMDACPACGSHNIIMRGHVYTRTTKAQRFLCNNCGKWSSDSPEILAKKVHIH